MSERPTSSLSPSPPPAPPAPYSPSTSPEPHAPSTSTTTPLSYEVLFSEAPDFLPAEPLPSPEDIEQSPHVIKELCARCTCRVGHSFVVKWGTDVEPIEGHNLQFVREHTNISVPRLFAIYQRPRSPTRMITYILMECIPGDSLENLWSTLADSEKKDIIGQLRKAMSSLRQIPHQGYFGSIGNSKLRDDIFDTFEPMQKLNGPYSTEGEFIDGMISSYSQYCGERGSYKAEYYRRVLPKALRGSGTPVFTHDDLQRKNVMVRPDGTISIVDWAASGWYPSYWEYATAMFACGRWMDDWNVYLAQILEEFPNHYAWLNTIRVEMWS